MEHVREVKLEKEKLDFTELTEKEAKAVTGGAEKAVIIVDSANN